MLLQLPDGLPAIRANCSQIADDRGATTGMVQAALRHANARQTSDYKRRRAKGEVAELVGDVLAAANGLRKIGGRLSNRGILLGSFLGTSVGIRVLRCGPTFGAVFSFALARRVAETRG